MITVFLSQSLSVKMLSFQMSVPRLLRLLVLTVRKSATVVTQSLAHPAKITLLAPPLDVHYPYFLSANLYLKVH